MTTILKRPLIHPALTAFIRPSDHSKFSPSGAERWIITACPASIKLSEGIPNEDSVFSIEGTLGHSVGEAMVRKQFYGMEMPVELMNKVYALPDMGGEMLQCAEGYAEVISYWLNNTNDLGEVLWWGLERGVPVFPEEECFGTGDCIIIGTKGSAVIDLKYGKGKNVAANSIQLKVYAAGIARYISEVPEGYLIHCVVYQPRTDMNAKEISYTMPELNQFLGVIWESIQASKENREPVKGSHCHWCPARRTKEQDKMCPIFRDLPIQLAKENFNKFFADMNAPIVKVGAPNPNRDEALVKLMALKPLIDLAVKNAIDEFEYRLGKGEAIPGVHIVQAQGNREIVGEDDKQKAETIKAKFPELNPWKIVPETKKIRTLGEMEKEVGKNKFDSICVRKLKKKLEVQDEKTRTILGEMAAFGEMINYGEGQTEDT